MNGWLDNQHQEIFEPSFLEFLLGIRLYFDASRTYMQIVFLAKLDKKQNPDKIRWDNELDWINMQVCHLKIHVQEHFSK